MADSETAATQNNEQTTTTSDDKGQVVAEEKKADDSGSEKVDVLTAAGLNPITVYISSVSLDTELKFRQRRIIDALESKKIPYKVVDIANDRMAKRRMRHMSNDENAVPPRIFRGEIYLGDYFDFQDALDQKQLEEFLAKVFH